MKKRWLHVSETFLGTAFLFVPRVPQGIDIDEDSTIPRICVADTIEHCVMGIYGCGDIGFLKKPTKIWVYELRGRVKRPTLKQVPDRYRTNEHWLLEPTVGVLCKVEWLGRQDLNLRELYNG